MAMEVTWIKIHRVGRRKDTTIIQSKVYFHYKRVKPNTKLPTYFTDEQTIVVGIGGEDQLDAVYQIKNKRRKNQHLGELCTFN